MKKVISIFLALIMIFSALFVVIPASAQTMSYAVDWTEQSYEVYGWNGSLISRDIFEDNITITMDSTTISANRIDDSLGSNSYISTTQFEITKDTNYTYEVMAKNNTSLMYSGIPFAIDADGKVCFLYGSFENNNDSYGSGGDQSSAFLFSAKGDFDRKYPYSGDEYDAKYFKKLSLTGGFASLKFEYDGLTVSIYAKDSTGVYSLIGYTVSLSEGAKIAFGLFTRDAEGGSSSSIRNRTMTAKNATVVANNDAAVEEMLNVLNANNKHDELLEYISNVEKDYLEIDYTESSYSALKTALSSAKALPNYSSAEQVSDAKVAIENAISYLVVKTADFTALNAAISKAETFDPNKWTSNEYAMLMIGVERGKTLIETAGVKQSEVNAAEKFINDRISVLMAYLNAKKTELVNLLGSKKENTNNLHSADSYEKYSVAYDAILDAINSAETIEELEAIDVANLKAVAEAKLITTLLVAKAEKITALGDKIVNDGKYTYASYVLYSLKYDEIKSQIESASTLAALNNINIAVLKAAAEELLVSKANVEEPKIDDQETEAKESEETEPKTDEETEPKTDEERETEKVSLGCDASIAISALAVVGIIGAAVAIKKKED